MKAPYTNGHYHLQVVLKHANTPLSDETQMRHVIQLDKNIIVFTSEPANMDHSAPSSSASVSTAVRNPLQPVNAQLPASSNANPLLLAGGKTPVKTEERYSSPYVVNENTPSNLEPNIGTNTRIPAPYGPLHPAIKSEHRNVPIVNETPVAQQGM